MVNATSTGDLPSEVVSKLPRSSDISISLKFKLKSEDFLLSFTLFPSPSFATGIYMFKFFTLSPEVSITRILLPKRPSSLSNIILSVLVTFFWLILSPIFAVTYGTIPT